MRTRVKVCGITHLEDALAALNAGANALGFIFSQSPRQVSPDEARSIIERLPPFTQVVGVFVNEPREWVQNIICYCGLAAIQLQGDETNEYCQAFDVPVIKSFHLESTLALDRINDYQVSAYLLDTQVEGLSGGSGKPFDWSLLKNKTFARPVIVAGGLHAGNVSHLIQHCFPTGHLRCLRFFFRPQHPFYNDLGMGDISPRIGVTWRNLHRIAAQGPRNA